MQCKALFQAALEFLHEMLDGIYSLAASRSFGPVTPFVVFKFLVTVKTDRQMSNQGLSILQHSCSHNPCCCIATTWCNGHTPQLSAFCVCNAAQLSLSTMLCSNSQTMTTTHFDLQPWLIVHATPSTYTIKPAESSSAILNISPCLS